MEASAAHPFSEFVYPDDGAQTAWSAGWRTGVGRLAAGRLRPKYGEPYGYEAATQPNAEMMAFSRFEYR